VKAATAMMVDTIPLCDDTTAMMVGTTDIHQ